MKIDLHTLREMPSSAIAWIPLQAWIKHKIYITNVNVINCTVHRCNFTDDKRSKWKRWSIEGIMYDVIEVFSNDMSCTLNGCLSKNALKRENDIFCCKRRDDLFLHGFKNNLSRVKMKRVRQRFSSLNMWKVSSCFHNFSPW